jgi:hypothetical protein
MYIYTLRETQSYSLCLHFSVQERLRTLLLIAIVNDLREIEIKFMLGGVKC